MSAGSGMHPQLCRHASHLSSACGSLIADLAVKAVDEVHAFGLVIAPGQVEALGEQQLEREQRQDDFH